MAASSSSNVTIVNICHSNFIGLFFILLDKATLSYPHITNPRRMTRCPSSAHCQETMASWGVMRSHHWRRGATSAVWTKMTTITTTLSGRSSTSVACASTGTSTTMFAAQAIPTHTKAPSILTILAMPGLLYFRWDKISFPARIQVFVQILFHPYGALSASRCYNYNDLAGKGACMCNPC